MTFSLCKSLSERGDPWQEKDRQSREVRLLWEGGRRADRVKEKAPVNQWGFGGSAIVNSPA